MVISKNQPLAEDLHVWKETKMKPLTRIIALSIVLMTIIFSINSTIAIRDYSDYPNCSIRIYSINPQTCNYEHISDCPANGEYISADCSDGIKIIEKIEDNYNKNDICVQYNIGCDTQNLKLENQIANLTEQVNQQQTEIIILKNQVNEQESVIQKILNFIRSIFSFK